MEARRGRNIAEICCRTGENTGAGVEEVGGV